MKDSEPEAQKRTEADDAEKMERETETDLPVPDASEVERRTRKYAGECVELLKKNDLIVTTAESCTGGMIASRLVDVPGCSEVFAEGYITYSNKAKRKLLNVSKTTLRKYDAVSRQTAREMAIGAAFAANADVSVSVTGLAGPDGGTEKRPVGLVFIGCYMNDRVTVEEHHFRGERNEIRAQAAMSALKLLKSVITENTK